VIDCEVGATARCGGAWLSTRQREGQRGLRLAPEATREDKRGEGGPKSGNGGELAGLTMWGGGDGRKCTRDRVTDERGLTRSGRGREERQARGVPGPTRERRGGPSLDEQ
jgi:hypothetical protein